MFIYTFLVDSVHACVIDCVHTRKPCSFLLTLRQKKKGSEIRIARLLSSISNDFIFNLNKSSSDIYSLHVAKYPFLS